MIANISLLSKQIALNVSNLSQNNSINNINQLYFVSGRIFKINNLGINSLILFYMKSENTHKDGYII